MTEKIVLEAFEKAKTARLNAYAPYSKFKVGAALITDDDKIFTGHNIENASFGGTVCAERVAIWKAVSDEKQYRKFKKIVLVTEPVARPCGMCLQVFSEFCDSDFEVYFATPEKIHEMIRFDNLLPERFNSKDLPSN